jgi:hypothetical protein
MAKQFIQQQVAKFRAKYPSTAPKKETTEEIPKVQATQMPGPAPKKSGVI